MKTIILMTILLDSLETLSWDLESFSINVSHSTAAERFPTNRK